MLKEICDTLQYFIELAEHGFDRFEYTSEKYGINVFIKSTESEKTAEIKIAAYGPWPKVFHAKKCMAKFDNCKNCNFSIEVVDKTEGVMFNVKPEYDSSAKMWILGEKTFEARTQLTIPQYVILKIRADVKIVLDFKPNLENYIKEIQNYSPELSFNFVCSLAPNKYDTDVDKYCQVITKAVGEVLAFTSNLAFKKRCFGLLNVSSTRSAEKVIVKKVKDCIENVAYSQSNQIQYNSYDSQGHGSGQSSQIASSSSNSQISYSETNLFAEASCSQDVFDCFPACRDVYTNDAHRVKYSNTQSSTLSNVSQKITQCPPAESYSQNFETRERFFHGETDFEQNLTSNNNQDRFLFPLSSSQSEPQDTGEYSTDSYLF